MSLTKVNYVDGKTVITAKNLNDIQNEIIANGTSISSQGTAIQNLGTNKANATDLTAETNARTAADTALTGEVNTLKSSLNGNITPSSIVPTVIQNAGIRKDGSVNATNNYVCTDFVTLPNECYKISVNASYQSNVGTAFYDSDKNCILGIDGTNVADYGGTSGTSPRVVVFYVPTGAKYIRATMRNTYYTQASDFNIIAYTCDQLSIEGRLKGVTDEVNEHDIKIDDLQESVAGKVDVNGTEQITPKNCEFMALVQSANRCNPALVEYDKGINTSGEVVSSEGYLLTPIIEVTDTVAWFGINGNAFNATRLGLYDANQVFKQRVNSVQGYTIDTTQYHYIRASLPYTTQDQSDVVFVGFNHAQTAPEYDTYSESYKIKPEYISKQDESNFNGTKVVAFGTSLTERAIRGEGYYGFLQVLPDLAKFASVDNRGIGGSRIMSDDPAWSIYLQITGYTDYSDKNVALIEGFVNDWENGLPLGVYTDTGSTSVCGRLRNAIIHIMTQNPYITIFVILDHYGRVSGSIDNSSTAEVNGLTQYEYYEECAKVCKSLGVFCIKEYAVSGIGELAPQYLQDYIHLNALGAKQSAKAIWSVMQRYYKKVVS